MIFGTFAGSLADRYGRKNFSIYFCILYILSCITKHFKDYNLLMIGRLTGGISTSLLFSVFESWLVCENNKRGFSNDLLGNIFSFAIFGNSLVAIISGFFAQKAADIKELTQTDFLGFESFNIGGFTAPFDLSICILIIAWIVISFTWNENYGEQQDLIKNENNNKSSLTKIKEVTIEIINNKPVLLVGLVQSLFEGAMYSFVFMWTPGNK